jgi:hypothetical protein
MSYLQPDSRCKWGLRLRKEKLGKARAFPILMFRSTTKGGAKVPDVFVPTKKMVDGDYHCRVKYSIFLSI